MNRLGVQALLVLLSIISGSTDIIGFLGLAGLFTAHITGNLVILAARFATGAEAPLAPILSVPVFIAALGLTRLTTGILDAAGRRTLHPLLLLQFVLLAGFLAVGAIAGPQTNPNAPVAIIAGMLGVCAMAVQNALVQISLKGSPSTAAMTSNVTRLAMDIAALLLGGDKTGMAQARASVAHTLPVILGFTAGCGLGAVAEATLGLRGLILPVGLALFAFAASFWLREA